MARRFNLGQRIALYLHAQGKCEECGTGLQRGWHGDHVRPWVRGGGTVIENGQALCPDCNRKKGANMAVYFSREAYPVMKWGIDLRPWHTKCLGILLTLMNAGQRSLSVAAVMGAGKTILALRWLHYLLERRSAHLGIVVVPTDNLRLQFCRDAKGIGLRAYAVTSTPDQNKNHARRVSCIPGFDGPLPSDAHIIVITYAQIAIEGNIKALKTICAECHTAWVFDEVHHSGDGRGEDDPALLWADGMLRAAKDGAYRLLTTATPNRSDSRPIPFIRYGDDRTPIFDFIYDYDGALKDGHVRLVEFILMDGLAEWWTVKDGDQKARLTDPIPREYYAKRLATIVNPRHAWVPESLKAGVQLIRDMRSQGRHKDAAGLAVARNKSEAKEIADLLRAMGARGVTVVTYDDPDASAKIDAFRESQDEWIVAVRMVSEGIDIKRLRVEVYCTNVTTELLFLQIMGRVLRIIPDIRPQVAYVIVPPDPRIMQIIDRYRSIMMRALREKGGGDGPIKQDNLWYSIGANGFEDGRIYDSNAIGQYWLDEAGQYSVGNADVQTLIAMALRDQAPEKERPRTPPGAGPQPAGAAWDAEKHDTYDQIKEARSRLTGIRINSGRFPNASVAAQSVNSDVYATCGAIKNIRHDPVKLKSYLSYLQRLIEDEEIHESV